MQGDEDDAGAAREVSSPVCFAPAEVSPADVALWRRAERERLRALRLQMSVAARGRVDAALSRHLEGLLGGDLRGTVISGYWPIKGEPDLRAWLRALLGRGAVVALPVVVERGAPLVFRRWEPGMAMERGMWNIPVPPAAAEAVLPQVALAPLVGWDAAGYRLGYGGGYFDRTLAALTPRPRVIGVGLQGAQLATIHPQPHDVAMDVIVTEAGVQVGAHAPLAPQPRT
jgi:5-formyltetrahydrofolate cyclo-ligase